MADKKTYYRKQRTDAEERADEGDTRARSTVSKIYSKIGRKPRQYTDTEEVNKAALGTVAAMAGGGPEGAILKGAKEAGALFKGGAASAKAAKSIKNVTPAKKLSGAGESAKKALTGSKGPKAASKTEAASGSSKNALNKPAAGSRTYNPSKRESSSNVASTERRAQAAAKSRGVSRNKIDAVHPKSSKKKK